MSKKRKSPPRLRGDQKAYAVKQVREIFVNELDEMRQSITDIMADYAMIAAAVAAFDTFGTAGAELTEFNKKFLAQFDCIVAGTVSIDDLKGLLDVEAFSKVVDVKEMRDREKPILVGAGSHLCICWRGELGKVGYWAKKYGLKPQTLRSRLKAGWDVEKALTTAAKGSAGNG